MVKHRKASKYYETDSMSEEIEIPIPPRFCGSDLSFLSMSEQIIPPIITRMNSVGITLSNRLSCLEMLGMVLI